MKYVFTVGVSASGKSTWANQMPNSYVICRDVFRHQILREDKTKGYNPDGPVTNIWNVWKWKNEDRVTKLYWEDLETALHQGQTTIVFADTNLNRDRLNQMIFSVKDLHKKFYDDEPRIEIVEFPIDYEEAVKRDNARPDGVGAGVIWKQYLQFLDFTKEKKASFPKDKPLAVIFDVDGTLAEMNGRGAFDWDKVDTDLVREEILNMLIGYQRQGYEIIVMSGRDGVSRAKTEQWLHANGINVNYLFMRTAGDMRPDSIIKKELYFAHVEGNFNVRLVVDDRPKVCRAWRELGLNVAQVADPLVEF